ncbi:MAG: IS3 family transposase [Rhodocyclaceae bacterium]|nr:IS3 family transposase [Rhodocyclaceae bacterium]
MPRRRFDSSETDFSERPSYGYRRACAILNRSLRTENLPSVNHKRVYRLMSGAGLLLPKRIGFQPQCKHEGTVLTLRSNTRCCSDAFQMTIWDGR